MSVDNVNTAQIIRSRGMSVDSDDISSNLSSLEYPIPPSFGQIKPRIRHHQDQRGSLFALNFPELPFRCRRLFVVTEVPKGMTRGKHAHYKTEQVLLCVSGRIEIKLDRVFSDNTVILTPGESVFHSAMEWAEIKVLEKNSVLLSACSTDFDADDYIGNYVEFQSLVMQLNQERKKSIAMQNASLTQELIPQMEGPVPTLNLKANYESIKEEVDVAMQKVLASGQFVNDPAVRTFESQFAMFVGTKHCVGVSNGTDALVLALEALEVGPGDEVILQGNAGVAEAMAIDSVGARAVLVDHDEASFQLDLNRVEAAVTDKTKAVLVVHMFGSCCDMTQLKAICTTHHLKLIEHCTQAHGASWEGRFLGSFGDVGTWSFHPEDNLGAYGDAGGVTTDSDALEDRLRLLQNDSGSKGLNHHRLDAIHAAVLSVKLQYVLQWNRRRQELARMYYDLLCGVGDITFPTIVDGCIPAYSKFIVCTEKKDALVHWLQEHHKIEVSTHHPVVSVQQQDQDPDSRGQEEQGSPCDHSLSLSPSHSSCSTVLSLPVCPMMSDAMVMHVVTAVKSYYLRAESDYPRPPLCPK